MKPQQTSAVVPCTPRCSCRVPHPGSAHSPTELSAWESICLGPGTCQSPSEKLGVRSTGSEQGGCSELSAPRRHHLGAERDCCIAAQPSCACSTRATKPRLTASPSLPAALALPRAIPALLHLPLHSRASELHEQGTRCSCSMLQSPACKPLFPVDSALQCYVSLSPPFIPARSFVLQAHRRAGACWALRCSGDLSSPAPIGRQPGVSAVFSTPMTALHAQLTAPQPRGEQQPALLTCTGHASDVAGFADEILHDRQHTELVPSVLEHQTHPSGPPHSLQPHLTKSSNIPRINKTL